MISLAARAELIPPFIWMIRPIRRACSRPSKCPSIFFDLKSAGIVSRDEQGFELPDAEAAHDTAVAALIELPAARSKKAPQINLTPSRFATVHGLCLKSRPCSTSGFSERSEKRGHIVGAMRKNLHPEAKYFSKLEGTLVPPEGCPIGDGIFATSGTVSIAIGTA